MPRHRTAHPVSDRRRALDDYILARHPRHATVYETLACELCAQTLDEALARRRRLDEQERRARWNR